MRSTINKEKLERDISDEPRENVVYYFKRLIGFSLWKRGINGSDRNVSIDFNEKNEWFIAFYRAESSEGVLYTLPRGRGTSQTFILIKRDGRQRRELKGLDELLLDLGISLQIAYFFYEIIFKKIGYRFKLPSDIIKESKFRIENTPFKFVLGSGTSIDYGGASWQAILDEMSLKICNLLHVYPRQLSEFNSGIFGTNYGIPEILKLIDKELYFNTVRKMIYRSTYYDKKCKSIIEIRKNKETILSVLAKKIVLVEPTLFKKTCILSLNYDNYLEREIDFLEGQEIVLDDNLSREINLFNDNVVNQMSMYPVFHCHGYLSKKHTYLDFDKNSFISTNLLLPAEKKSLVFADDEYKDKYKKSIGSSYTSLYNFLNEAVVFVGNSLVDFEEQRTISEHFEDSCFSSYHFVIFKKEKENLKFTQIRERILFNMGILCKYVDEYSDIPGVVDSICLNKC